MRLHKLNPGPGLADFWSEFTKPQPYRWLVVVASLAITGTLLYPFVKESVLIPPEKPKVTYITTFAPGRSDAEIMAENIANQERQDALRAERAAREERRKEIYRTLGRATGVNVDEMERQIAREEAAEKAAREAEMARLRGDPVDAAAD